MKKIRACFKNKILPPAFTRVIALYCVLIGPKPLFFIKQFVGQDRLPTGWKVL